MTTNDAALEHHIEMKWMKIIGLYNNTETVLEDTLVITKTKFAYINVLIHFPKKKSLSFSHTPKGQRRHKALNQNGWHNNKYMMVKVSYLNNINTI